jgi:hypothetical protein
MESKTTGRMEQMTLNRPAICESGNWEWLQPVYWYPLFS